jgi:hypothetical protein
VVVAVVPTVAVAGGGGGWATNVEGSVVLPKSVGSGWQ